MFFMKSLNKIVALLLIATFLASIPMVFAQNQPQYTVVVNVLRDDSNFARPDGSTGKPGSDKPTPASTDYLLMGIKWKIKNPLLTIYVKDEVQGEVHLLNAVQLAADEWDSNSKSQLFSSIIDGQDIEVDTDVPDFNNEIVYGNIAEENVIAVTYTWYNSRTKAIVQFDMVLDSVHFSWGNGAEDSSVMDVQNIVTHELGHGLGLADLYPDDPRATSSWAIQTMFGFATKGETMKRTLEAGDIAGITRLYG